MQPKVRHPAASSDCTVRTRALQRLKGTSRLGSNQSTLASTAKIFINRMTKDDLPLKVKCDNVECESTIKISKGLKAQPNQMKNHLNSTVTETTKDVFLKPVAVPSLSVRTRSASAARNGDMKKSQSFQNLKIGNSRTGFAGKHIGPASSEANPQSKVAKRTVTNVSAARQNLHGSATCLVQASKTIVDSAYDRQSSPCSAHRISINSDLLSRVEKEKKQYESRISELTQITESRKMEIEKLTFEVRRAKEDAASAALVAKEAMHEAEALRCKLNKLDNHSSKEVSPETTPLSADLTTNIRENKLNIYLHSPSESVGTTTRLTPGVPTTVATTATVTASSVFSDWNDTGASSADFYVNIPAPSLSYLSVGYPEKLSAMSEPCGTSALLKQQLTKEYQVKHDPCESIPESSTVVSLQGRLLQMEEANCTTNEELQATLQELWDLQKSVDEAHEETRSLAFERAILLEALSTQTTKLEHCRFQIEQLKYLLLTDRTAQTTGARENHFCELYSSIEQEKQVLLGQNNDLAQSSESLTRECRILTEKATQLQDNFDALEAEHNSLKIAYQSISAELNISKSKTEPELLDCRRKIDLSVDVKPKDFTEFIETTDGFHPIISQQGIMDVHQQQCLLEVTQEIKDLRERFDHLQSQYDRECTEWRLHERDLLKAVRVADKFQSEAETKAQQLELENQHLKGQIEHLKQLSSSFTSEASNLNQNLSVASTNLVPAVFRKQTEEKVDSISSSVLSRHPAVEPTLHCNTHSPPLTGHREPTALITSTTDSTTICSTEVVVTKASSGPGVSVLNAGGYSTHPRSSANFGHLHRHHSSYVHSPGAPGRCLGPTVRNLIQSIENQVKAVQHQQRGITSKQPSASNHLPCTSSSPSSPLRTVYLTSSRVSPATTAAQSSAASAVSPGFVRSVGTSVSTHCPVAFLAHQQTTAATGNTTSSNTPLVSGSPSFRHFSTDQQLGNSTTNTSSPICLPPGVAGRVKQRKARFTVTGDTSTSSSRLSSVAVATTRVREDNTSAPGGPVSLKQQSADSHVRSNHESMNVDGSCAAEMKNGSRTATLFRSTSDTGVKADSSGMTSSQRDNITTSGGLISSPRRNDALGENRIVKFASLESSTPHRRISSPTRSTSRLITTPPAHVPRCSRPTVDHRSGASESGGVLSSPTTAVAASADLGVGDDPVNSSGVAPTGSTSLHHFWQDPLQELARRTQAGSKRNALLRWCQSRISSYPGVEVTNFSSSWNSGLALCALLHTYRPDKIPWNDLVTSSGLPVDRCHCFEVAFSVAESDGIPTTLHLQDMLTMDRPDWSTVMGYVTSIYRRYEVETGPTSSVAAAADTSAGP